jgi:hypothetical protein
MNRLTLRISSNLNFEFYFHLQQQQQQQQQQHDAQIEEEASKSFLIFSHLTKEILLETMLYKIMS